MLLRTNIFRQTEAAVIVALLSLALISCSKNKNQDRDSAQAAREVQTVLPQSRKLERFLTVTGSLAAREQANISVKVAGRLGKLLVDIGSPVKKGEVMAQVDPRDYELRLQLARAALAEARATLGMPVEGDAATIDPEKTSMVRETKAVLDEAKRNRDRAANLQKEGIASKAEWEAAEAGYKIALQKHEAALETVRGRQAALAQRQAELDLAQQQLADTNVRAPFDGVVQARLANFGEYVSGGAQIVTLVQVDPLRLRLEISERNAGQVQVGQQVRLRVDGRPETFSGTITRVSPAISELNRMLVVEADIPNSGTLRPGQLARAEIVINAEENGLAVPAKALIVFAGLEKIVVVENGEALEKNVKTGRRGDDWIEITSGLKQNEKVVLNPGGLRTGQPVTVTEINAAASPRSSAK